MYMYIYIYLFIYKYMQTCIFFVRLLMKRKFCGFRSANSSWSGSQDTLRRVFWTSFGVPGGEGAGGVEFGFKGGLCNGSMVWG